MLWLWLMLHLSLGFGLTRIRLSNVIYHSIRCLGLSMVVHLVSLWFCISVCLHLCGVSSSVFFISVWVWILGFEMLFFFFVLLCMAITACFFYDGWMHASCNKKTASVFQRNVWSHCLCNGICVLSKKKKGNIFSVFIWIMWIFSSLCLYLRTSSEGKNIVFSVFQSWCSIGTFNLLFSLSLARLTSWLCLLTTFYMRVFLFGSFCALDCVCWTIRMGWVH